ncbi:MAG: trypsin-like peptidase domain-containing protein [Desulfatiglandales bacterium]
MIFRRSCGYREFFDRMPGAVVLFVAFLIFSLCPLDITEATARRSPVVIAVERVGPAVVNISTTVHERMGSAFSFGGEDFFRDFFPELFSREYTRTSLGSGVIIDGKKGYIVTNHHVVAGAAEIKVTTSESREFMAKVLGSDPRSDIAVLQIETKDGLPEVEMGSAADLMIGETVIAIGNPFGLSHTVTTGVISALDRSVRTEERIFTHFIQTDASINPGNSGGPLLNIDGELIGINTAIYQKAQGIGFAIPIDKASRIVKELLRAGEVRFPWLGLELQGLTEPLRRSFGFGPAKKGILVSDVIGGSPADRAGLKRGDILMAMGGIPVADLQDYREGLAEFTPSDSLSLKIFRKGKELEFSVKLASFPPELSRELVYRRLGIRIGRPDGATLRRYGLRDGVMITEVRSDSEAGRSGLASGDLILKVNEVPLKNPDAFDKAVIQYHHLPSLTLIVQRGRYGYSVTLPF